MTIRTVYLAHPIDQVHGCPLADQAARALVQDGYVCYRPSQAWHTQPPHSAEIQRINNLVQRSCDATVAVLPHHAATIGTPFELAQAIHNNQPAAIVTDIPAGVSAMLEAMPVPVVRTAGEIGAVLAGTRPAGAARWDGPGQQPGYGKPGDAGFDLYVDVEQPVEIPPGGFANIPSNIAVQLPPRLWGLIVGRSSSWKRRLYIAPAVIDAGYRGDLYACTWNVSDQPVVIAAGERIAQLIPMPLIAPDISWTRTPLDPSERGTDGFGSTGR
jgi:dUTP pyrophosphatase